MSHDIEDIVAIIDGRPELLHDIRGADPAITVYLSKRISALLATDAFCEALPGHLPGDPASQDRLPDLLVRLEQIANLQQTGI